MDVRDPCRDQVRLSLTSFHHFLRCDSLSIRWGIDSRVWVVTTFLDKRACLAIGNVAWVLDWVGANVVWIEGLGLVGALHSRRLWGVMLVDPCVLRPCWDPTRVRFTTLVYMMGHFCLGPLFWSGLSDEVLLGTAAEVTWWLIEVVLRSRLGKQHRCLTTSLNRVLNRRVLLPKKVWLGRRSRQSCSVAY